MPNIGSGINPTILRWARERAGYSLEDVAIEFGKSQDAIEAWENGTQVPTYNQLEKLAYQLYKRPLALFFFPEAPAERDPATEFRTLPTPAVAQLSADTRYAVRLAISMQTALRELNGGKNPSEKPIFRTISAKANSSPVRLATVVRERLGITLDKQRSWGSTTRALQVWRDKLQDGGVFVFKRSFKQREISGFCLIDAEFPVIFLNNSTSPSRQIFTLLHELAHILLHMSGVTVQDDLFIEALSGRDKSIEVLANKIAAETLVPTADFESQLPRGRIDDTYLESVAARYSVSREVILRRLLDRGLVGRPEYERRTAEWNDAYEKSRASAPGGGDYYKTQIAYLGEKYLELAFNKFYQGQFGVDRLADLLNVRVKSVAGLEQALISKATR